MSTESITPDIVDPGILLSNSAGERAEREYAWGERPAEIRRLHLKYPELSQSQIAAIVGCSQQNVSEVLVQFLVDTSPERLNDYRDNKPAIFEALQYRTLSSITQSDIDKTPFIQRVTAAAIMEDKIRLMRGQPTSIHVHALVDVLSALREREREQDE